MAKEVYRKAKPSPPNWFWPKNDGCWDCNCKRHGYGGCKRLKIINHIQSKRKEIFEMTYEKPYLTIE